MKIILLRSILLLLATANLSFGYHDNIFTAIQKNDLNAIKEEIKIDPECANRSNLNRVTPLIQALFQNPTNSSIIIDILLKNGASKTINKQGPNERTALFYACCKNNPSLVKKLLSHGAQNSINIEDYAQKPPLVCAWDNAEIAKNKIEYEKSKKIIKILLKNGALKSLKTTPDHFLCFDLNQTKIAIMHGKTIQKHHIDRFRTLKEKQSIFTALDFQKVKSKPIKFITCMLENPKDQYLKNPNIYFFIQLLASNSIFKNLFENQEKNKDKFLKLIKKSQTSKNQKAYTTICKAFKINKEKEYLLKTENYPQLLKYIIKKINLYGAQSKSAKIALKNFAHKFSFKPKTIHTTD